MLKVKNDKLNCMVGDIVEFDTDTLVINKIEERKNFLERPLIANIDHLGVTYSLKSPDFDSTSFQKMLLNSFYRNIEPIVIFTKSELLSQEETEKFFVDFSINFKNLNLKQFVLNIDYNTSELLDFISGKIIAFSGPSGVGKSTLINKILNEDLLLTGDISEKTEKGRHTTIESRTFELKDSTLVIDTPGFSSLNFPSLEGKKDLDSLFPDFEPFIPECKFRNCLHINEPGCGVKNALENGEISKLRYDFYLYTFNNIFER